MIRACFCQNRSGEWIPTFFLPMIVNLVHLLQVESQNTPFEDTVTIFGYTNLLLVWIILHWIICGCRHRPTNSVHYRIVLSTIVQVHVIICMAKANTAKQFCYIKKYDIRPRVKLIIGDISFIITNLKWSLDIACLFQSILQSMCKLKGGQQVSSTFF